MRWRTLNLLCALLFGAISTFAQASLKQITFDYVIGLARERAAKPFQQPKADLPEELRGDKLNYDTYRQIEFRRDRALWLKEELPFRLEFFHPGYLYEVPLRINEFNSTHAQPVRF